mmetsp:Transcript_30551/g.79111  ORF Transcript_30551/g.79111 Transcript_30551/m.79111 type:complete len:218 (+) Transcript_30551:480-1133(+)
MDMQHVRVRTPGPTEQCDISADPLRRDWRTADPAWIHRSAPGFHGGQRENNGRRPIGVWSLFARGLGSKVDSQLVYNQGAVGERWSQSCTGAAELRVSLPELSQRNIVGALTNHTRCAGRRLRDQAPNCWPCIGNRSKRKLWSQHTQSAATHRQPRCDRCIVKKNHPRRIRAGIQKSLIRWRILTASNRRHFREGRWWRTGSAASRGLGNLRDRSHA